MVLLYPLAGWIADVYIGRYKAIRHSILLMWVTMTITTMLMALHRYHNDSQILSDIVNDGVYPLALFMMNIGLAGFKANIIPFGTDQLMDAPSNQQSAYIHWFVWTLFVSVALDTYVIIYIPLDPKMLILLQALFQTACLSMAVAADFLFGAQWLVVEPGSCNPVKTVLQVLRYTAKHKYPERRSAFTYGEIPSRIDFAKQRYGGNFTTEQVEDVKTFLRIVVVLFSLFGYFVNNVAAFRVIEQLSKHLLVMTDTKDLFAKYTNDSTNITGNTSLLVTILLIPLYEFLIYPLFHKFIPSMLKRIGAGMVLVIVSLLMQLAVDVAAHLLTDGQAPCMFSNISQIQINTTGVSEQLVISNTWLFIPRVLNGIAMVLVLIAIFEFICAQSPYAMKGLLIGVFYCSNGIFLAVGVGIRLAFKLSFKSLEKNSCPKFPSCGFLYYLVSVVVMVAGIIMFVLVARAYRKRKREDVEYQQSEAEICFERNLLRTY